MDYDEETLLELIERNNEHRDFYEEKLAELRSKTEVQKIEAGQLWADTDMRNAVQGEGGMVEPRTVEIVEAPTPSKQGVFRVVSAPNNKRSEGQTRGFTEGKLRAHYALVRRAADNLGDGIAQARELGVVR